MIGEFDVLACSETWIWPNDSIEIDNFVNWDYQRLVIHPNAKRNSGGISIYVKQSILPHVSPLKSSNDNIVWVKFNTSLMGTDRPVAIAFVYFPPSDSTHSVDQNFFNTLEHDIATYQEHYIIYVAGDVNARIKTLPDWPIMVEGSDGDLLHSVRDLDMMECNGITGKFNSPRVSGFR
jgi:hypothetical protein